MKKELEFLKFLVETNGIVPTTAASISDYEKTFQNLKSKISSENNIDVQKLMIFSADEISIKKFGITWARKTLEKELLSTSEGGIKFFEEYERHLKNKNIEMISMYLTAIDFGFTGNGQKIDFLVEKGRQFLCGAPEKVIISKFKPNLIGKTSFIFPFLPFILYFFLINTYEFFLFSKIKPLILSTIKLWRFQ